MRKIMKFLVASTVLVPILFLVVMAEKNENTTILETAAGVGFTETIDVSPYERFSAQAVYSNGTSTTALTVNSGTKSKASITVNRADACVAQRSAVRITISSNGPTALIGAVITLNGIPFTQGIDWDIGVSSLATSQSISNAINDKLQFISTHTPSGGIIISSAAETGIYSNGWTATVSVSTTVLTLSSPTFQGGEENGSIKIGDVNLVQGVDWTAGNTIPLTAQAISSAIVNNAILSLVVTSTHTGSVVWSTSVYNGAYNYSVSASSGVTATNYSGGTAGDIDVATDTITKVSHKFTTGLSIFFATTTPNVAPGGLANNVTYYAIRLTDDVFRLASSTQNAVNGTSVNITTLPDFTASTYTLTAISLATGTGTGFFWSASNNNTNFINLPLVSYSSVTYLSPGTSIWDFGTFGYRYLRFNYVAPTRGGIALTVKIYGKKD